MGSCVSMHKGGPESTVKLGLAMAPAENEKILIQSPVKPVNQTVADVALNSKWSPAPGSKDDAFFDSQPWLESDCEDDFFSVNGDFTPSRGNTPSRGHTPVHRNFPLGNLIVNKSHVAEGANNTSAPEPSPPDRRKRLSELFRESVRGSDKYAEEENAVQLPNSNNETPYLSGANSGLSSVTTPSVVLTAEDDKPAKSVQCCLPKLLSSRGSSERKKRMSPTQSVG